jgi:hypothetical protein
VKRKLGFAATAGVLATALILVLAACGGSDDSDGVASLTDTTGQGTTDSGQGSGDDGSGGSSQEQREEAALEFAQCMREHGIDFPDPVNGRFDFNLDRGDQQKVEAAQEACADILEDAGPPPLDEEQQAELQEATLEFAACMREHGIDMPDPKFEDGGGILQMLPEGAEDDPRFEEAQDACQPILDAVQPDGASPQEEEEWEGT